VPIDGPVVALDVGERRIGIAVSDPSGAFAFPHETLQRAYHGRIERVDERLTTAAVQKQLIGADVSRAKRKAVVDKLAATLILETYLARARA